MFLFNYVVILRSRGHTNAHRQNIMNENMCDEILSEKRSRREQRRWGGAIDFICFQVPQLFNTQCQTRKICQWWTHARSWAFFKKYQQRMRQNMSWTSAVSLNRGGKTTAATSAYARARSRHLRPLEAVKSIRRRRSHPRSRRASSRLRVIMLSVAPRIAVFSSGSFADVSVVWNQGAVNSDVWDTDTHMDNQERLLPPPGDASPPRLRPM